MGMPGKLHLLELDTGKGDVTPLVEGLVDVSGIIPRPGSDSVLLVDSKGNLARYQEGGAPPRMRLLDLNATGPRFTPDGRFFLYVEPETYQPVLEGRLMIQDGDFQEAPRRISAAGTSVGPNDYFFLPGSGILVFWAHFGRNPSDLYFANPETGEARVVAEGIREVSVTSTRVLGIIRLSQQDLVGDLVQRNALTGEEQVLAYSVSAVTVDDPGRPAARVAFVVRERAGSHQDGLWATTLK
jgi:hypothetical protein